MKLISIFSGCVAILLSGCTGTSQQFTKFQEVQNKNNGLLYVYREYKFINSTMTYSVTNDTDKIEIGTLRNESYLVSELPAGDKEIIFDIKFTTIPIIKILQFIDNKYTNNTIPITIKPNEITCIKFNSRADENGTMIEAKDRIIATDKCLQEIKNTHISN